MPAVAVDDWAVSMPADSPISRIPKDTKQRSVAQEKEHSMEELVGVHWFQWIGIAALVAALLFFLKWSFDNGLIGPTGRTLIGYLLAGGAIVAGDRLREKYGVWSLAFTGGGAFGSFIVTWIAHQSYHLFPAPVAFAIYILTTVVVCLLAGYYNAIALAAFGIIGGFLTPFLTGGGGSTASLLLYVLILDIGIVALGHARQWRVLNALGFVGTALYEMYALSDGMFDQSFAFAFIAAFLVIYVLIPFYYNLVKQQKSEAPDLLILIGNALLHFGLVLAWLDKTPGLRETYDALVSLVFAAIFLLFASEVYRRNRKDAPLALGSLSLAVLFASIAIPLQLGDVWVPLAWSVEGTFLLWMALTLRDSSIQRFAWIVMAAAYIWYLFVPSNVEPMGLFFDAGARLSSPMPVAFLSQGFLLFLAWAVLFVVIASIGLTRDDRKEQTILPFAFTGLAVLAVALFLNATVSSTLNGVGRFCEAAALIGGSYVVLFKAQQCWRTLYENEKTMFTALGIAVQIITLLYLTDEFRRAVDRGTLLAGYEWSSVGTSILWALYGAVTLVVGMQKNWKPLRLFSLIVLIIAMAKLTLIDLMQLGTGYRVIGFTILGSVLVASSFLYQRKKEELKSFFISSSDHE